jgi:hypothetical protein
VQVAYSQRLSLAEHTDMAARSLAAYQQRMHLNNGVLITPRSNHDANARTAAFRADAAGTSRRAGGEIMRPASRSAEVVQAFAAEVATRQAVAGAASGIPLPPLSATLLHELHGSQLTPRLKFAFPQTSAQEVGWHGGEPVLRSNQRAKERADFLVAAANARHEPHPFNPTSLAAAEAALPHFLRQTGHGRCGAPDTDFAQAHMQHNGSSPFRLTKNLSSARGHGSGVTLLPEATAWTGRRKRGGMH